MTDNDDDDSSEHGGGSGGMERNDGYDSDEWDVESIVAVRTVNV